MYALGLLSIAQMLFLPGLVLLRALRLRAGGPGGLLAAIPLSLTVNHLLVVGLVGVRAYRAPVLLAVVALELGALAWPGRRGGGEEPAPPSTLERLAALAQAVRTGGALRAIVWWTLAWLSAIVVAVHVAIAVQNVGTVFDLWDAVVSWNRWATEWAGNRFPQQTWRYPQLLPSNVSLSYVLVRSTSVQLFAKAAMGVFPVAPLLVLADLALRRRSAGYLGALVLLGATDLFVHRMYLTSGYADLPVAFMVLGSLQLLLLAEDAASRRDRAAWLALAVVAGAGAALTKQAGLLWAAVLPVLATLEWRRLAARDGAVARGSAPRLLAKLAALTLALALPWYAVKEAQIRLGREADERTLIARVNGHQTRAERATQLHAALVGQTTAPLVDVGLPLVLAGALLSRRWRWPALLFAVPHLVICAVFTSYDLRNLAPAWPVLFTSGALGWAGLLASLAPRPEGRRVSGALPAAAGVVLAALVPLLLLPESLSRGALGYLQAVRQKEIGLPELNVALYGLDATRRLEGRIVTNYQLLRFLPTLGDLYVYDEFVDLDAFRRHVADPANRYVLIPVQATLVAQAPIRDEIEAGLAAGRYRPVLEAGPPWAVHRLLEIERSDAP